jgi:2OG-Fe(II) oxygenase superfamily
LECSVKVVAETGQFHVYDDVLSDKDFRALWQYVQLESYVPVHHTEWVKVWRISDGIPLGATVPVVYQNPKATSDAPGGDGGKSERVYPTHTGLDRLIETLVGYLDQLAGLIGKLGIDFEHITARSFLYPEGTGLSWHEDAVGYTGGYVFYAHPEWNAQWGGELLIADESARRQETDSDRVVVLTRQETGLRLTKIRIPPFLDNTSQNAALGQRGMGAYVAPKPNRLVVIAAGNPHMIHKVSAAAGDHVRCTIAGFFIAPRS